MNENNKFCGFTINDHSQVNLSTISDLGHLQSVARDINLVTLQFLQAFIESAFSVIHLRDRSLCIAWGSGRI